MNLSLSHLGNEHESLPYHEGAEDDHGEVEALEEELALVRPELLELEDLLVYHLPEHCFFVSIQGKICERGGQQCNSGRAAGATAKWTGEGALGRRFKGLEVMPLFHICSICHTFLIKVYNYLFM